MKILMLKLLLAVLFLLPTFTNSFAESKQYYFNNPFPNRIKELKNQNCVGVYVVEKLGIKKWYGHLAVTKFDTYIPAHEICGWNEVLSIQDIKGWVYIDSTLKKVHISVVVKDEKSNKFKPFKRNGVFNLK